MFLSGCHKNERFSHRTAGGYGVAKVVKNRFCQAMTSEDGKETLHFSSSAQDAATLDTCHMKFFRRASIEVESDIK
jgi:hypothetical protein